MHVLCMCVHNNYFFQNYKFSYLSFLTAWGLFYATSFPPKFFFFLYSKTFYFEIIIDSHVVVRNKRDPMYPLPSW